MKNAQTLTDMRKYFCIKMIPKERLGISQNCVQCGLKNVVKMGQGERKRRTGRRKKKNDLQQMTVSEYRY